MRGLLAGWAIALGLAATIVPAHADAPSPPRTDLPPVLTATNPPGQTVITPTQARAVTAVIWSLREYGRSQRDPSLVAAVETGAAAELDARWMRGELASTTADEAPRELGVVAVAVPRQDRLPAFFLAYVGPPGVHSEFLVFTRTNANEPWQLALEAITQDIDRVPTALPQTDADGYVASAQSSPLATSDVPRQVLEFWQHWAAEGTPPPMTLIASTEVATSRGDSLYRQASLQRLVGASDRIQLSHRQGRGEIWEIDYPNGFGLTCFSLHYAEVRSGSWWRPVTLRRPRTGEPTAGPYLEITTPVLEQDCALVYSFDAASGIALIADQVTDEPRSGVPVPQPWLPIGAGGLLITGSVIALIVALRPGTRRVVSSPVVPLGQVREDTMVRSAALMLARALAVAQVMAVLLILHPVFALELLIIVGGWLAWRLLRRRGFTASATAVLPQSPDDVFAYVAHLPNHKDWSTELESVEPMTDGPAAIGAQYRLRQELGDGRRIEFVSTIVDLQPGACLATSIDGPSFRQTTVYTFRAVPTGTEVTSSITVKLGPLHSLAGDDLRKAHVNQVRARRAESLERLRVILADPNHAPAPRGQPQPALVKGLSLLKVSLVVTLAAILVTLNGWWPLTIGCWVAEGWCVLLCIHEFAHFFVARSLGENPRLPVVTRWVEAAVELRARPASGLALSRISAAGPVAVALGAAASVTLYASFRWSGLLWWAAAASLITVANLLPVANLDGSTFLGPSARWFAVLGVGFGVGVYVILVILGLPSVVLAAAAVIALGAGLAPFVRAGPYWQGAPGARLLLGLGWLAVFLYVGFVAVIGMNWLIPLS